METIVYITLMLTTAYTVKAFRVGVYTHRVILPTNTVTAVSRTDALKNMMKNIQIFKEKAATASKKGVQILVFPEDGIYGFNFTRDAVRPYLENIADPTVKKQNPCKDGLSTGKEIQHSLSCMAMYNKMYIIANMGDIQICNKTSDKKCPDDGHYQFNTDVVYDPKGGFIAKYHKYNLFFEYQFDYPPIPEYVYFDTLFGRFGVITCFDIIFHTPLINLVETLNVTNIVFPTAWMDAFPIFAAIQFHSSVAIGLNVNVLAANIQHPELRFHGSGIYSPTGYKTFHYSEDLTDSGKLLIADLGLSVSNRLNKIHSKDEMYFHQKSTNYQMNLNINPSGRNSYSSLRDNSSTTFKAKIFYDEYTLTILQKANDNLTVCNGNLCCNLNYSIGSQKGNNNYAFGAFDGLHTHDGNYYLQICTLLECNGQDKQTCGQYVTTSDTYFNHIKITGTFSSKYIFPKILGIADEKITLISGSYFNYKMGCLEIETAIPFPLLSVNLVSRDYTKDFSWNKHYLN